jgi:SAM-dependent methyltransferase
MKHAVQQFFVKKIYADHNDSRAVKRAIAHMIARVDEHREGLNIGAGNTRLSPFIRTMEIEAGEGIDIVGSVESIPCDDGRFDVVITQEVLEHVPDPFQAIREIARVLKPGGRAYVQLPFIIGYHPCPNDYWRFTQDGIARLAAVGGLRVVEHGTSVGVATGFYRILVEFFAILFSLPISLSYRGFKAFFSLVFYPVKWLDRLLALSPQAHRIEGGYYVILEK